jgi:hypothetical protein
VPVEAQSPLASSKFLAALAVKAWNEKSKLTACDLSSIFHTYYDCIRGTVARLLVDLLVVPYIYIFI